MNYDETLLIYCMVFYASDPDYAAAYAKLDGTPTGCIMLDRMNAARVDSTLRNEQYPDVLGAFYARGGVPADYGTMLDRARELGIEDDIIYSAQLEGAAARIIDRRRAATIRPVLDAFEAGRATLEDLAAAVLGEEQERVESVSLPALIEAEATTKPPEKVPTLYPRLDACFGGGLTRRHMTILAARPAVGKSDYALSIARSAMRGGRRVYLASLEMDRYEILGRLRRAERSNAGLLELPGHLEIDDRGSLTVPQIAAAVNVKGYDLVIVDHMQLLTYPHRTSGLYERMTLLSNQIRTAAKHSGAAWLVLSQLSRQARNEQTIPQLADLRDSGAIEQDAYAVMFLHEPEKREQGEAGVDRSEVRNLHLTIAKNRGGACRFIEYEFTPSHSHWHEQPR